MNKILVKKALNPRSTLLTIYAPNISKKALPGQFVIVMAQESSERIPLAIFDYNRENSTVSVIFDQTGVSTAELQALSEGDSIAHILGPLGKPSDLSNAENVCFVGGGSGCVTIYSKAKMLHEAHVKTDILASLDNEDSSFLCDCLNNVCDGFIRCKDSQASLVEALRSKLESGIHYDRIVVSGSIEMMKEICELTKLYSVKTTVVMSAIMLDGTGMCGGCRLTVGGQVKFACVDGPEFDGHLVDFEEAVCRLTAYDHKENAHACRMAVINEGGN